VKDSLTDCHPLLEILGSEPNASRQAWQEYISEASEKAEKELIERYARGLAGNDGFGHAIVKASLGRIRPKRGRPGK
jgi:hypothetical protein